MTYGELSALIMDTQEFLCYVTDVETYELLYVNESIRSAFGFKSEDDYLGKPCYKMLQNKEAPCEFCNNHLLKFGENYTWDIQNNVTNKHYSLIDTLIEVEGRKARLEVAFDVSTHYKTVATLTHKLTTEETLVRCIQTLVESVGIDEAINSLLAIVGEYYQSSRAYIFEFDLKTKRAHNTYEWCQDVSIAEIDNLQNIPMENLLPWTEGFETDGEICITDLEKDVDNDSDLYKLLKSQNIHSLLVVPLRAGEDVVGFIGVDDPQSTEQGMALLHSVAIFVLDDLQKRRMRQQLEYLSYTDSLTGLYNRNKYIEAVEALDNEKLSSLGVLYVDVNGLKKMNDIYGHGYGDSMLQNVSKTICTHITKHVYRVGGDEFIALCPNVDETTFEQTVNNIRAVSICEQGCTYSVGSIWREGEIDVFKEVAKSDEIMYAEKQNYYKTLQPGQANRRMNAAEELLSEIHAGRFCAYLQPKVNMETGAIVGAEALVRKTDEAGHLVPPDRFIPGHEYDGTIRHVDFYILETVCAMLKGLIAQGRPLTISVNFSRVTFMEHDLVDEISHICAQYGVPHRYINVEITETIDKVDNQFFDQKLTALKDAGFAIAMDDFGAKYSNLLMLSTAQFSEVKIDKSLVDGICESRQSHTVVRHIIQMVQDLGMAECLAEGVETEAQKQVLLQAGCIFGQGYLFYKPMPLEQFVELYQNK